MRAVWDGQAATFDDEPDHGLRDPAVRRAWATLLLPLLTAAPSLILDVGCGRARHLLWAFDDPDPVLAGWVGRLKPRGRLLLVEGRWSTGAGLSMWECRQAVARHRQEVIVDLLDDPALWGGPIQDERYLIHSRR